VSGFPPAPSDPRFAALPKSLAEKTRMVHLGGVPSLVAHPDWERPAPFVVWMHGRTVSKELDPGRYQRWLRAGIAAVALDLPGHGERKTDDGHTPERTLANLAQMASEIDGVLDAVRGLGPFDPDRAGIGGMSAGGMAALVRLSRPHGFRAAAVECTTGNLSELYFGGPDGPSVWPVAHDRAAVNAIDPMAHLDGFAPIPTLVLHNELDEVIPLGGQQRFVEALRRRYQRAGADGGLIEWRVFGANGSPQEHAGFGRMAAEAKTVQTEFLARALGAGGVGA
jgi:dienelactone hydrolase